MATTGGTRPWQIWWPEASPGRDDGEKEAVAETATAAAVRLVDEIGWRDERWNGGWRT